MGFFGGWLFFFTQPFNAIKNIARNYVHILVLFLWALSFPSRHLIDIFCLSALGLCSSKAAKTRSARQSDRIPFSKSLIIRYRAVIIQNTFPHRLIVVAGFSLVSLLTNQNSGNKRRKSEQRAGDVDDRRLRSRWVFIFEKKMRFFFTDFRYRLFNMKWLDMGWTGS